MNDQKKTPPTYIKIGPDVLVIMDGGEEWSLVEELNSRANPGDWSTRSTGYCPVRELLVDIEKLP